MFFYVFFFLNKEREGKLFFFFFQAEDGIRDDLVTGVQTCALPIFGLRHVDPGMLYRLLRAMEQEGLVRSSWQGSEIGPPRRTYQLSDEGQDWLHAWAGSLRETTRIIGLLLGRYQLFVDNSQRASRSGTGSNT